MKTLQKKIQIICTSICMRLFNLIDFFFEIFSRFTQKQFEKSYIIVMKKWGYVIYHTCKSICPCTELLSEYTRSIDRLHVLTQPTCDRQNSPVTQRHHRISQQTTKLSRDSAVVTMIRYIVDVYKCFKWFLFLDFIKQKCILITFYIHGQFIIISKKNNDSMVNFWILLNLNHLLLK